MRPNNKIVSGLKLVYLDVMERGKFLRQVKYYISNNPLFPKTDKQVEHEALEYVKKTYPSLASRDINVQLSNDRIFH